MNNTNLKIDITSAALNLSSHKASHRAIVPPPDNPIMPSLLLSTLSIEHTKSVAAMPCAMFIPSEVIPNIVAFR